MGQGLGKQAKILKSYKNSPKRVLGPGNFKTLRIGPELQDGSALGINVIKEAQLVIYFIYMGCKLRNTQDTRPNFFYVMLLCDNMSMHITCHS